jgi:PAS domain S-box-containing protein
MTDERPLRILHVDDEKTQLELTKLFLEQIDEGLNIRSVLSPEEALKLQEKDAFDCIISDYKMLSMNGIELAEKLREKSDIPFILYTGQGSEEVAEKAFNAGIDDYLRKEGEPTHFQVLAKRIRHTVEKHRTDELYKKVVEESRDAIVILRDNKIQFLNKSAYKLMGVEATENCIGKDIQEFLIDAEDKLIPPVDGSSFVFEGDLRTWNGSIRGVEVTLSKTTYHGEDALIVFIRDITEKKRNAERLDAIYQQAVWLNSAVNIQEVSEKTLDIMETVFGYQTITFHIVEGLQLKTMGMRGTQYLDLTVPILGKGITTKAVREGRSILVPNTSKTPEFIRGSTDAKSELAVPALLNGETVAVLNVESLKLNDFTDEDRKLLETLAYHVAFTFNRIKRNDKEAIEEEEKHRKLNYALGRLDHAEKVTAMVKEELQKNLLSIINASLLLRDNPELSPQIADSIDANAEIAKQISDRIRMTVSGSILDDGLIEVNQLVRKVLDETFLPRNIRVKTQYDEALLIVEIDGPSFTRVLNNLLNNAIEAMPGGGTLSLKITSLYDMTIEVKDTGMGIHERAMYKLFHPFNTTKPGHSGLGLAFCKNIIESNGGSLEMNETSDKGTTFVIKLPLKRKI